MDADPAAQCSDTAIKWITIGLVCMIWPVAFCMAIYFQETPLRATATATIQIMTGWIVGCCYNVIRRSREGYGMSIWVLAWSYPLYRNYPYRTWTHLLHRELINGVVLILLYILGMILEKWAREFVGHSRRRRHTTAPGGCSGTNKSIDRFVDCVLRD